MGRDHAITSRCRPGAAWSDTRPPGPLLTKTLLFLGEGSSSFLAMPPLGGGRMFRAFDKATGAVLWQTELPAGTSGAPMTYVAGEKQYIVVAVSERDHEGELVAFALP